MPLPAVTPTVGRIVHYTLSQGDADAILAQRGRSGGTHNEARTGDVYPAVVVRTFGGTTVNLRVLLDGNDTYWATSRTEAIESTPGSWCWPPRA